MYKYILPFFLFAVSFTCDAQGPTTSRSTHKCSGEVVTTTHARAVKTPRLLGNVSHIWGGNRGFRGATRFDRWSSKRKRTCRGLIVGGKK